MDVKVDFDRCEANGVCVGLAPDVFDLNDDDELIVTHPVPGGSEDAVREAVAQCPRAALAEA
ncbi:ferredoxin [Rhodococcus sp. Rp3]|uniref:ferredoxin n=1 Tax=Rhodococcus sp. Rp3 TaxID=2807635 RepID=UPI00233F0971|nr:ferredoxin [Rhodococcus sp. Rp3]MDC3725777.1 ferredoxin [Rhodococcus sp. Rp3]